MGKKKFSEAQLNTINYLQIKKTKLKDQPIALLFEICGK